MAREILFKAKRTDNGEWVMGGSIIQFLDDGVRSFYMPQFNEKCICKHDEVTDDILEFRNTRFYKVDGDTICQYKGLTDKNGNKIWENDITKLVLPDGEVRYFKVSIKSVVRKVVNHPDFIDGVSKVEITGVVFEWNGYELFPCVDETGTIDYKKMQVVGNIFDNPELLGGGER